MGVIDVDKEIASLLDAAKLKSDNVHDIVKDALYEKDFTTFVQLLSESHEAHNGALNTCALWSDARSASSIVKCKANVEALYDEYEKSYIDILNKMCR